MVEPIKHNIIPVPDKIVTWKSYNHSTDIKTKIKSFIVETIAFWKGEIFIVI